MYTWTSAFPKDYHILVINKWNANTSKFPWQRLGRDRTSTDSEGTCKQPAGSTEGSARPENLPGLHLDVTQLITDEAGAR